MTVDRGAPARRSPRGSVAAVNRRAWPLLAVFALAACGREPAGAGKPELAAEPADLPVMEFRTAAADDPLLGPVFTRTEAGYSLRPPAGWEPVALPVEAGSPLRGRTAFRDPGSPDLLDVSVVRGGPAATDAGALLAFKAGLEASLNKEAGVEVIGTDAFRFHGFKAVQILLKRAGVVVLQVMVFRETPGEFLQVLIAVRESRYHDRARAIEGCLASLAWPAEGRSGG